MFHNCIECKENFLFKIIINDSLNCFENCNYYHYFDNENNFHCTTDLSCPEEYPLLAETRMECIKPDVNIIQNTNGNNNKADILNEEEIKNYDNILKSAEQEFTSDNYDTNDLDNGIDKIIETEKLIITFTTIQNQKNNIYTLIVMEIRKSFSIFLFKKKFAFISILIILMSASFYKNIFIKEG